MSLAYTVNALMFTVVGSLGHTGFTVAALAATGVGIFVTTWFLLDLVIAAQDDAQRRRAPR
ncbi:hypothetical protein [Streptacidiphilus sp. EB129]|uniref:hypothetical protein n=1 Tax=Streptacidiphilus sp. EB129 TaxID=3156262 RepID=UPI0035156A95